jgi:hypothetical protein
MKKICRNLASLEPVNFEHVNAYFATNAAVCMLKCIAFSPFPQALQNLLPFLSLYAICTAGSVCHKQNVCRKHCFAEKVVRYNIFFYYTMEIYFDRNTDSVFKFIHFVILVITIATDDALNDSNTDGPEVIAPLDGSFLDVPMEEVVNGNGFDCDICGNSYKTKNLLKRHLKKHSNEPKTYECPRCTQYFPSQGALNDLP